MNGKSEAIEKFLNDLTPGKMTREEAYKKKLCVWCREEAEEFDDEISKKEYEISILCQKCQDETFGRS